MKHIRGDTLIEVALAIGIFSLVAIMVVSVISASTSSSQSSLETTLTREELDAQAEALRFIHDSYINGTQSQSTQNNAYAALWNNITGLATDNDEGISYNPEVCSQLYDNKGKLTESAGPNPFIIDIRTLSNYSSPDEVLKQPSKHEIFYPASTYPRIIYGRNADSVNKGFYDETENSETNIYRVEGIFIIAKKGNANIVSGSSSIESKSAYYDFYIRSCWMPLNADRASTISTVVRLYDPAIITY